MFLGGISSNLFKIPTVYNQYLIERAFSHIEIYHFEGNNRLSVQNFGANDQLCPVVSSLENLKLVPEVTRDVPNEFLAEIGHGNVVILLYDGLTVKERMIHLPAGVLEQRKTMVMLVINFNHPSTPEIIKNYMNTNNVNFLEVYLFEYDTNPAYCMTFPLDATVRHIGSSNLHIQPTNDIPLHINLILPIYKRRQVTLRNQLLSILSNDIIVDVFDFFTRKCLCELEIVSRFFKEIVEEHFKKKPLHPLAVLWIEYSHWHNTNFFIQGLDNKAHYIKWPNPQLFGQKISNLRIVHNFSAEICLPTKIFIEQHFHSLHTIIEDVIAGTRLNISYHSVPDTFATRDEFALFLREYFTPELKLCRGLSIYGDHLPRFGRHGQESIRLLDVCAEVNEIDLHLRYSEEYLKKCIQQAKLSGAELHTGNFFSGPYVMIDFDEICDWLYYYDNEGKNNQMPQQKEHEPYAELCSFSPSPGAQQQLQQQKKRQHRILRLAVGTLGEFVRSDDNRIGQFKLLIERLKMDFLNATMSTNICFAIQLVNQDLRNNIRLIVEMDGIEEFSLHNAETNEILALTKEKTSDLHMIVLTRSNI